jgi:hypothetical protein
MKLIGEQPDPIYVRARRVLLDAFEALAPFREAVILVGAQAIYLHTGDSGLAVAPYTTDADLVLDPELLLPDPKIVDAMQAAGFAPTANLVGTWTQSPQHPSVDLLVPEALGGPGRRGARLGVHGNHVARKGRGLEAAIVDKSWVTIGALDPADVRHVDAWLAGPAALLVAKLHKLAERAHTPSRLDDKDALDVFRILQSLPAETLTTGIGRLRSSALSEAVTTEAVGYLSELFAGAQRVGSQMAARALTPLEDPTVVAASCAALAGELLYQLR